MNKAILIGNLARDPETMTTASGITKCNFTIAVQRRFANAQGVREADFLPVVCWRQTAELCAKYLAKGRKVAVIGPVSVNTYTGNDGQMRAQMEITANEVEFLSPRSESNAAPAHATYSAPPAPQQSTGDFIQVDDDELPFD